MSQLEEIMPFIWWAFLGLLLCIVVLLVMLVRLKGKISRFEKAYTALQTYTSGQTLDGVLDQYMSDVENLKERTELNEVKIGSIEGQLKISVDKMAIQRFNAFEKGSGNDLSFTFAMVNSEGDGMVLTSIQTREDSRLYAKPLNRESSSYPLSEEEVRVIRTALNKDAE